MLQLVTTSGARERRWWQDTVVYQIYPRSFADANGDGIGDLQGIRAHLDHVVDLGVGTIWLSPIFTSPMADFGYDVADHCGIDPIFGTLDDFDELLDDVHARDMRLLLDWVPNHTSREHPWFRDAATGPDSEHRDFYVWRDPGPNGEPPNNWTAAFAPVPAWTFDEASGQYYLHLFLPDQPDLNWANPRVEEAMHDTLRFWLDRGVDGFRADVVHLIGKDPTLADDPAEYVGLPHVVLNDVPAVHPLLRRIRELLDSYPREPMMIGEVYLLDVDAVVDYLGDDDELHLSFNFAPLSLGWDAGPWRGAVQATEAAFGRVSGWPTWVLSNHDVRRHRTRFATWPNGDVDATGSEERARAAAVLLTTLRGTPFLYQGEELGLLDAEVPAGRVVDPGGRDGCRAPIPWNAAPGHGWVDPWLPLPPEADVRNVEAAEADAGSILHLYRELLALRRERRVLIEGSLDLLDVPEGVIGFRRHDARGAELVVLVSTADTSVVIEGVDGRVVITSDGRGGSGSPFPGVLAPRQAVVIEPDTVL